MEAFAADSDGDHVDVVERRAVGIGEEGRGANAVGLAGGAEAEGSGEVWGAEGREAVGECGGEEVFGLGEEGERAAAEAEEALRGDWAAGGGDDAAECVGVDGIGGEGEGVLDEGGGDGGGAVGEVKGARFGWWAGMVGELGALRGVAGEGEE